jgi:hypothetical protein
LDSQNSGNDWSGIFLIQIGIAIRHAGSDGVPPIFQLLGRYHEIVGTRGFRFQNKLLSLDGTLIEFFVPIFEWAW